MKRLNSKTFVTAFLVVCILIWLANISQAKAAAVFVNVDSKNGQGISLNAGGVCYVVTPFHVVENADKITLVTSDRYETEAYLFEEFGHDIDVALLRVSGDSERICTQKEWTAPHELPKLLEKASSGSLLVMRPEGSSSRKFVDITDLIGERFIKVKPKSDSDQIEEGMSGAPLRVGDVDVGMLLEVAQGEGRVLRQDFLYSLISNKLQLQKYNRFGLAMGYTRFKKMDEVTYTMAGAFYARRLISFNHFNLAFDGYLDLTLMTSLNSEETIESGIWGDETTFGRAVSFSISYVQSVLLGNNLSVLIETGYQRLDVDLKIDGDWDKLYKNNILIGGGFEYNYKRFFVQTIISAVIGEDKSLGHDLNATIKTGINF